ncbi:MAG: flavin reductase family protein [Bacteroidota bacterium]|jgi:flavin reductase (DIM6/NTAB) family NADH-FMN oxidoreductase RutF
MEQSINLQELENMERRKRATLLNSLAGFRPVILVGTKSLSGNNNLAIFNSLIHFGADPALWGIVCRPDALDRDTYRNIVNNKTYSFSMVPTEMSSMAHQTSAKYDSDASEFEACGFGVEYAKGFDVPLVKGAIANVILEHVQTLPISLNGTSIVIGKPVFIRFKNGLVEEDGFANLSGFDVLGCCGLDAYVKSETIARYAYAKPGVQTTKLER